MVLFLRLLLAHFVGDFILQFDEVYEVKKKSLRGALVHYLIVFFTFLFFSLPYLSNLWTWVIIIVASITHAVQDEIKLRYVLSPKLSFVAFVVDQVLHVLFIAPALLFSFAYQSAFGAGTLINIYNNNALAIVITGYIISVFMGAYLLEAFKEAYLKADPLLSVFMIKYGMLERFIITTSAFNYFLLLLLVIPIIFRVILKKFALSGTLIFNLIYAYLIGVLLTRFLPIF